MIYLICRALFMLVVLEEIHANRGRHHHKLTNYHHDHSNHHNVEHDNDNDNFVNNVKSDNERVDEMNDDDDYYDYMNDLSNQQEEIAVGDSDVYDYGDNDKDTIYEPPDDYQGDEGAKVNHNSFRHGFEHSNRWQIKEQQEAQRYTRTVQDIRSAMGRSHSVDYDYQSDDYRNPNQINEDKRQLETLSGVQKARDEKRKQQMDIQEINNRIAYIENEWRCYKPRAKLVPVDSDKPNSRLRPNCVVLHKCGTDTGCCNNTDAFCLPLKTELVSIPFYEERIAGAGDKPTITVIQMQFVNHTECGCQKSSDQCKCPSLFVALRGSRNSCTCECLSQNMRCLNQRNGITQFSIADRECIKKGYCKVPQCSYGNYNKLQGVCPKQ